MNRECPTEADRKFPRWCYTGFDCSYIVLFIAISLSIPTLADARVAGGSNLSSGGYPKHRCHKPVEPAKPDSLNNQWRVPRWEVTAYNESVLDYNAKMKTYNDCITRYVENANNDIERIRQKAEKARSEAE
ncbi:hypothetical protein ACFL4M_00975 [Pseudomonadota bacterium]